MPTSGIAPFSVGWVSERLYRVHGGSFEYGQGVELDGWDDALATAWGQLTEAGAGVLDWVTNYLNSRGDEHLIVTFNDARRVVGRHGNGYFGVTYPADLLLVSEDQVAAMRSAILVVLDRHVERSKLSVPTLSELIAR